MRILIFHYHLNPGGVTRIIESQVLGLKTSYPELDIQVITGACEKKQFFKDLKVPLHINPIMNYLVDKNFAKGEISQIELDIKNYLCSIIKPDDILHVHNINLGKNPVSTKVMFDFFSKGHLLINHAHDFAEDRPVNKKYLDKIFSEHFKLSYQSIAYPNKNNYKVAVLNRFDYERVLDYGIKKENCFLLPNPVLVPSQLKLTKIVARKNLIDKLSLDAAKKILTYPVRVIRRKNIGELILLAVLFKEDCQFLVTLPPQNPIEIEFYNKWLAFCQENNIHIIFEAGKKANFEEILLGSDYCISTSIQEGFGMAYLEPWTFETAVIGRNIESVTVDLKKEGVEFPLLYSSVMIDNKDFKKYSDDEQRSLILKIMNNTDSKNLVIETNPFLKCFPPDINTELILKNKNTISKNFSITKYAQRLFTIYN